MAPTVAMLMCQEHIDAVPAWVPGESTVIVQKGSLRTVCGHRLVHRIPERITDAYTAIRTSVLEILRPDGVEAPLIGVSPEVRIEP